MTHRRLLLLSNSRNPGQERLAHARDAIREFLGADVTRALFVPFAVVGYPLDEYVAATRQTFLELGYDLDSVHQAEDMPAAVMRAEAIVVSGGNTFALLRALQRYHLLDPLRARVMAGAPYLGWSAGANLACPTIQTTNDMPIVEVADFRALGLLPFQINPHYTEARIPNHGGEDRPTRLREYLAANPGVTVVGLPEGAMLRVEGDRLTLLGGQAVKVFQHGQPVVEYAGVAALQWLLDTPAAPEIPTTER